MLLDLAHTIADYTICGEGNVSERKTEDTFLIKASGTSLHTLREEDLVLVDNDANQLNPRAMKGTTVRTENDGVSDSNYRFFVLALAGLTATLAIAMPSMAMPVLFSEMSRDLGLSLVQIGAIWPACARIRIGSGLLAGDSLPLSRADARIDADAGPGGCRDALARQDSLAGDHRS